MTKTSEKPRTANGFTNTKKLPKTLQEHGKFCLWRYEQDDKGRWTKVPYQPNNRNYGAASTNKDHFTDLKTAIAKGTGFDGVGLGIFDGISAIDIDHCIDETGELSQMAKKIIDTMDSYTERSPSGTGVRIIFTAHGIDYDKKKFYINNRDAGLEVYVAGATKKFVTITGDVIRNTGVNERSEQLAIVLNKYMLKPTATAKKNVAQIIPLTTMTDRELVSKAMTAANGTKFSLLWSGNWQGAGYGSQSEGDQALCNMLAFWTGRDFDRIDKLFRQSGLMRDKWERGDYSATTIEKAIDGCGEVYSPTVTSVPVTSSHDTPPDASQTTTQQLKKTRLTRAALVEEMHARSYHVRHNVITGEYETTGRTAAGRAMGQDDIITIMHDALADQYKGVSFDTLQQYIAFEARENRYNPVLDLLAATKWDGENRLPQLYALVGVEHDALSQTLIKKWLFQTVALLFNDEDDPFGADGCLVLNGKELDIAYNQGAGKTSFFRHLALKAAWFGEGLSLDDYDKDTQRRALTKWISELGEVESTLKSDISKLKAFVTNSVDRYRLPYGRSDIVGPRHTSLCATCNTDRYLIDPTGNRRWWTVPVRRLIPYDEIQALDALQLWSQVYAWIAPMSYKDKAASFRLTEEEKQLLAIRNGEFEKPLKGQVEVADILYQGERDSLPTRSITISEWKAMWDALRPYSAQQISAALKACGVGITRTKIGACAELPTPSTSYR